MPALKNARHEIFAQEVAKGAKLGAAYITAGYKPNENNAARLKGNEVVLARIMEIQGRGAARAAASVDRIVQELERLSFSDLTEAIEFRRNKIYVKDLKKLPPEVRACISSLKSTKDGVEVKFYNKTPALEMLMRHKGMFKENIDLKVELTLVDLINASYPAPANVIEHDPDETNEK